MRSRSGQATFEFALLYAGVILPLTFGIVFLSQMLWVWHSVVDFTRDGARYAATHCYQSDMSNVTTYMHSHVPLMIDQNQFQSAGQAAITITYYQKDPSSGILSDFSCPTDCSVECEPDAVSISVSNYQFSRLLTFMKLPPITVPPFTTSIAMESTGCDPTGNCLP
jgi:hypothetical protein